MQKNAEKRVENMRQEAVSPEKEACCTLRHDEITAADLPLSCPPRDNRVWDGHPRVYLPIEATGRYRCPYCGAEYILKDFIPV